VSESRKIPLSALVLGLAGLIPFFASSALMWVEGNSALNEFGRLLLIGYGAVILSFLGGARWGFEIARAPSNPSLGLLVASVLPSIVGWIAVGIASVPISMFISIPLSAVSFGLLYCGFSVQWLLDVQPVTASDLPVWYPRLRSILTFGAVAALFFGQVALM